MVPSHVWKDTQARSTRERKPAPCLGSSSPENGVKISFLISRFLDLAPLSLHLPPFSPATSFSLQLQPKRDLKVLKSFWFWCQIHKERAATGAQWVFTFFSMADLKDRQGFLLLIWHASYSITLMHDLPTKSVFYTTQNDEKFLPDSCPSSHSQFTHQVYSVFALWV